MKNKVYRIDFEITTAYEESNGEEAKGRMFLTVDPTGEILCCKVLRAADGGCSSIDDFQCQIQMMRTETEGDKEGRAEDMKLCRFLAP